MNSYFYQKRILITGGAGFIGSNLCHRLVVEGARVTVVDSLREGGGGNLYSLKNLPIHFFSLDLAGDFPQPELEGQEFDFVFNLAGSLGHSDSMRRPKEDLANNVQSHLQLLQWLAKKQKKTKIVFTSTRQVYGAANALPVAENAELRPVDINGAHKICAEHYHRIFSRTLGLPLVILRLTNTYGPRMALRGSDLGVANAFVRAALEGRPLKLFGGGEQMRDFLYVEDAVEALLAAAKYENTAGEIFNLGGEPLSLKSFTNRLQHLVPNLQVELTEFPQDRKEIEIGNFLSDDKKIREKLKWDRQVSFSDGIKKTLEFFRDHGNYYL